MDLRDEMRQEEIRQDKTRQVGEVVVNATILTAEFCSPEGFDSCALEGTAEGRGICRRL